MTDSGIRVTNLFLTGSPGRGKTSCIRRLSDFLGERPGGYQTIRRECEDFWGYWMEELSGTGRSAEISRVYPGKGPKSDPKVFDVFGAELLRQARLGGGDLVLLDEIGRFEKSALGFQDEISLLLEGRQFVIAALKKEKLLFHEKWKRRDDAVLFDLDEWDREELFWKIKGNLKRDEKGIYYAREL